jgi:hypothetical protein
VTGCYLHVGYSGGGLAKNPRKTIERACGWTDYSSS